MAKTGYTPWHEVVTLRDELRSGDLALSLFTARSDGTPTVFQISCSRLVPELQPLDFR